MQALAFALALSAAIVVLAIALSAGRRTPRAAARPESTRPRTAGSCGADGLDPVTDPAYNMRQVCKQSVLLEEHLNCRRKRCKDCCKKHFLHVTGLAEEAISLAGTGAGRDELMEEAVATYESAFEDFLKGRDPKEVADKCRRIRKKLMARFV